MSISHLLQISQKKERLVVGMLSGTSMDGVDVALVHLKGSGAKTQYQLLEFTTVPYPAGLREKLIEQMDVPSSRIDQIAWLHTALGKFFGQTLLEVLDSWKVEATSIDCVGSHGQTVFHGPHAQDWTGNPLHVTLQLGDADQIAVKTGIICVSDFRMKDTAVGGEGAPLLPYLDALLFSHQETPRILHNLGGISNLTYLPAHQPFQKIIAFDTGPANLLINLAVKRFWIGRYEFDPDGSIAASGIVQSETLLRLLEHPFFQKKPPKSTGQEVFGQDYLDVFLQEPGVPSWKPEDLVATLTALTAHSIQQAYQKFLPPEPWVSYFSGGGFHNKTLMRWIQELLPSLEIHDFADLGMPVDAREAVSFAILANELLSGNPITFPGITGAHHSVGLGKISLPY